MDFFLLMFGQFGFLHERLFVLCCYDIKIVTLGNSLNSFQPAFADIIKIFFWMITSVASWCQWEENYFLLNLNMSKLCLWQNLKPGEGLGGFVIDCPYRWRKRKCENLVILEIMWKDEEILSSYRGLGLMYWPKILFSATNLFKLFFAYSSSLVLWVFFFLRICFLILQSPLTS